MTHNTQDQRLATADETTTADGIASPLHPLVLSRTAGNNMKAAVGIALMIAGMALGAYFGLWWAFIGGIVDVIGEVRSPDLNALNVAIGVAKVFFSGVIGWTAALLLIVPGYSLATGSTALPG